MAICFCAPVFLRPFTKCSIPALFAGRTILRMVYIVVRPRLVEARLMCGRVDATEIINLPANILDVGH